MDPVTHFSLSHSGLWVGGGPTVKVATMAATIRPLSIPTAVVGGAATAPPGKHPQPQSLILGDCEPSLVVGLIHIFPTTGDLDHIAVLRTLGSSSLKLP